MAGDVSDTWPPAAATELYRVLPSFVFFFAVRLPSEFEFSLLALRLSGRSQKKITRRRAYRENSSTAAEKKRFFLLLCVSSLRCFFFCSNLSIHIFLLLFRRFCFFFQTIGAFDTELPILVGGTLRPGEPPPLPASLLLGSFSFGFFGFFFLVSFFLRLASSPPPSCFLLLPHHRTRMET